ncbi:MAG: hypothetical protein TUN42_00090 [Dehalogenimonas sp.]
MTKVNLEATLEKSQLDAIQHLIAVVFACQKTLKDLAPDYRWEGLGNLLGAFGELVAIEHYGLKKGPRGGEGFDAVDSTGKKVQIKTNYAATQIGFRGTPDKLLVIQVSEDGHWKEIYYGDFAPVKEIARYSARDNKYMIAIAKLRQLAQNRFV